MLVLAELVSLYCSCQELTIYSTCTVSLVLKQTSNNQVLLNYPLHFYPKH